MKLLNNIKSNILVIVFLLIIIAYSARVYINQTMLLKDISEKRIQKELELEESKLEYEKILALEEYSNTSKAKENQVRERLNMIKSDEVQFLFSNEE